MDLASLIQLGADTYTRSRYDSTEAIVQIALGRAAAERDSVAEARAVTLAGQLAYRRRDTDAATALGERGLAIKRRIGLMGELWSSYNTLGLTAWWEYRLTDALRFYEQAIESWIPQTDSAPLGTVQINRGLAYTDLGDMPGARTAFEAGLGFTRTMPRGPRRDRLEGIALTNLGMYEVWIGNPAGALALLEEARTRFRAVPFPEGQANAMGQSGTAYTDLGDLGRAIAVLDSAVFLAREHHLQYEEATNLEALAEAHATAGDLQRALDLYEEADQVYRAAEDLTASGTTQRQRAGIYRSLGQLQFARELAASAMDAHRSVDAVWQQLADLLFLADVAHEADDVDASRRHLQAARDLARAIAAAAARLEVAVVAARIADRSGNATAVLRILDEVEADLTAVSFAELSEVETLRSRALFALDRLAAAAAAGRRAVAALERARTGLRSGTLRTSLTASGITAYATLTSILLAQGDTAAAFVVADGARGRALLENLPASRTNLSASDSATDAFREGEELLREIGQLTRKLRDDDIIASTDRDTIAATLKQKRSAYEAARIRALERDSAGATLLGGQTASPNRIMDALDQREAIIEYLVTDDRTVGFVVTRADIASFEVEVDDERLARRVRVARSQLDERVAEDETRTTVLSGMYELLLTPAVATGLLTDVDRLIVVPHGVLNYLPFAALIDPGTGRYVIEDYTAIQRVPSASALPVLRDRSRRTIQTPTNRNTAFAPFTSELPASRHEARSFRRLVKESSMVTGRRATERRVREALEGGGIVHLATHGVLNPRNPMFSHVALASRGATRGSDDGRLEVHELLNLSIDSRLVFLSGCETGLGVAGSTAFAPGEDYATLAQAFLRAGADDVVATLWRVEDEGASTFAVAFYSRLGGISSSEALAAAQRELLSHDLYSAPYYWAPYQLTGSGAQNRVPTSVSRR